MLDSSPRQRVSTLRYVIGGLALLIAVALLVATVAAVADIGHLVTLRTRFSNPFLNAFVILLLAVAGSWLLLPVHSEADNRGRSRLRVVLIVFTVLSLLVALFVRGHWFVYDPEVVAHAPSGPRVVAKVRVADPGTSRAYHVHLFSGTGLTARDLGDFGAPCGDFTATFEGPDQILVKSVYGDFHLRFDPDTGAPLDHIGLSCAR